MVGLGKRLESLREKRNLSKRQISIMLGYSEDTYGRWERGKRKPDYEALVAIAKLHNVSLDYLLTGKEYLINKIEHKNVKTLAKS